MEKSSKTIRAVIILVLILILTIAAYALFFGEIRETNRAISLQRDSISGASKQELGLKALQSVLEATQEKRDALQNYIVTENGIVSFLESIESLEEQTGAAIEVRSIEKSTDKDSVFVEELSLNIRAKGSWEDVYYTFLLLEALPYKTRIDQIQFSKSLVEEDEAGEGDGADEWQGDFRFFVMKTK